jgi:NAD(P)-dependent dehydrogenase (short-subunit alcohol dehydrogenase family)
MIYYITGGSRGIGANLVKRVVEAGDDVAFTYVQAADQAEKVVAEAKALREDANVRCYQLDLRDPKQIESVHDQVVDDFETFDVVVNNAGISRDSLLMAMSDEEWDEVIAANLTGPFHVCRAALPTLIANRYGRIINISSVVAEGATGQANYAASKAGLHGLTKSIAKEYGRKRITANVVVPGFFETDMTRENMPEAIRGFWKQYAPVPKGRGGELDELASVIMFLASKGASFVNGQEIRVTGGLDWNP